MSTLKGIDTEDQLRQFLGGPIPGIDEQAKKPYAPREPRPIVAQGISIEAGRLVIYVAFETKSESNLRDWKARSRRSGEAWKRLREAIGLNLKTVESFASEHYRKHGALRITFTRLGGRLMDKSNLPAAMKGLEDALAYLIGANDGDPRWCTMFDQESGDAGVRIVVEAI